jgi:PEP-CTERM motif
MRTAIFTQTCAALLAALAFAAGTLAGSAQPTILRPSASLPLIGVPYQSTGAGAGCFTLASACVTPGPFIQTSASPPIFSLGNQFNTASATYDADLPPIGGTTIIGSVSLAGTLDEEVLNRMSDSQTGTFTVDITSINLTGTLSLPGNPLDGFGLKLALNPSDTSSGTTSVAPDGAMFEITSFFDVFVDVTLENPAGKPVASTSLPGIRLLAVPEPSTWAMMLAGFAGLGFFGYRRARAAIPAG